MSSRAVTAAPAETRRSCVTRLLHRCGYDADGPRYLLCHGDWERSEKGQPVGIRLVAMRLARDAANSIQATDCRRSGLPHT
jgi:hypothetical protein